MEADGGRLVIFTGTGCEWNGGVGLFSENRSNRGKMHMTAAVTSAASTDDCILLDIGMEGVAWVMGCLAWRRC